ncbi:MAG: glycosyl transferase family 28 [Prevotella sp.]|nr:glycosyl transferase family 28 [Prevotella sp.]
MIFASLGTMDMAFERMARAVDEWASTTQESVVVQTGYTDYPYRHAQAFKFCTKEEMQRYIDEADIVILQGGWGAISEAMEKQKKIVVMPRYNKTEHIHDQFQLVRKLDSLGCVIGVFDEKALAAAIERARHFRFQKLENGNAEVIIRDALDHWFNSQTYLNC